MTTLTVWKFDSESGARNALQVLQRLQKEELLQVVDAAIVTWPPDRKKPKTEQLRSLGGAGALGGAFWGLLFGLLFFIPLIGMAIGAAMGALAGSMTDVGIRLPFGEVTLTQEVHDLLAQNNTPPNVIVGIRPEHLEDASLIDTYARIRALTFEVTFAYWVRMSDHSKPLGQPWRVVA